MKKRIKYSVVYCVLTWALFTSCEKENMLDCFKSTGDVITERRSIGMFTEIVAYNNVNVILVQDSQTYLEVNAGENLLPLIVTELRDGKLIIENNNRCNWVRDFSIPINVYVHLPALRTIDTFGSGRIYSLNTLVNDTIEVNNRNTSDVELNVMADAVYCRQHAAFGDNKINGSAAYLYVFNIGQGFCDCTELAANTADVISNTTGHTYVNACDGLHAEISYSGNVYYKGAPSVSSVITGSGKLIQF